MVEKRFYSPLSEEDQRDFKNGAGPNATWPADRLRERQMKRRQDSEAKPYFEQRLGYRDIHDKLARKGDK
jgi:hypothetical protein